MHNSVPLIHSTLNPKSSMQLVSSIKNSIHDTKVETSIRDKIREFALEGVIVGNYFSCEEKQIPKTMQLFVKSITWKLLQLLKPNI